ncbi:hypothetical protein BGZ73_006422 [Actinomortierella ambigua]|nr:hypothetical protein BGZ73_006422 [Actinomortierella ambigua]
MKFTSIIASLAVFTATVVAIPAADNTPVHLYRRAPCDNQGQNVMEQLARTQSSLNYLESEYYIAVRNPIMRPLFDGTKKYLATIIFEIQDELSDPANEQSESSTLRDAREHFRYESQRLTTAMANSDIARSGSQLGQALEAYTHVADRVDDEVVQLTVCWIKAGGQ